MMTTFTNVHSDREKLEKQLIGRIEKSKTFSWSRLKAIITLDVLIRSDWM